MSAKKKNQPEEPWDKEHEPDAPDVEELRDRLSPEAFEKLLKDTIRTTEETAKRAAQDVADGLLRLTPHTVTDHLVKAQKELLMAGQRINQVLVEKLDACAERSRKLHEGTADDETAKSTGGKEKKGKKG